MRAHGPAARSRASCPWDLSASHCSAHRDRCGRRRRVRRVVPPPSAIRLAWGPPVQSPTVILSAPVPRLGRPQVQQRATSASRSRTLASNAGDVSAGDVSAGAIAHSGRTPPEQDVLARRRVLTVDNCCAKLTAVATMELPSSMQAHWQLATDNSQLTTAVRDDLTQRKNNVANPPGCLVNRSWVRYSQVQC